MAGNQEERKALRRSLIESRRAFARETPDAALSLARGIADWLGTRPEIRVLGLYFPIRDEPGLLEFFSGFCEETGRLIAVPVMREDGSMRYALWERGEEMTRDPYGVPVPVSVREASPDLVIAPAVGFTRTGFRLGYGGGCFDRAIPKMKPRPVTMTAAYEVSDVTGRFEPAPHDVRFGWIATELGVRPREERQPSVASASSI